MDGWMERGMHYWTATAGEGCKDKGMATRLTGHASWSLARRHFLWRQSSNWQVAAPQPPRNAWPALQRSHGQRNNVTRRCAAAARKLPRSWPGVHTLLLHSCSHLA